MKDLYPIGYSQHTVTTTGLTILDSDIYIQNVETVFITTETNSIRFRIDGENPTSSSGHLLIKNLSLLFDDAKSIRNFKCIAIGGSATMCVTYYSSRR